MDELDLINQKIREQMDAMADHMATGGCKGFEEYKYCSGVIAGLAVAEREILDIKQRMSVAD
jgi:hypothetical protein|tara:strand:- start:439 stop:624 length:186 start_codon:yes stop_codon:yes gene_type:complete